MAITILMVIIASLVVIVIIVKWLSSQGQVVSEQVFHQVLLYNSCIHFQCDSLLTTVQENRYTKCLATMTT